MDGVSEPLRDAVRVRGAFLGREMIFLMPAQTLAQAGRDVLKGPFKAKDLQPRVVGHSIANT
jgi:hypothetical protein